MAGRSGPPYGKTQQAVAENVARLRKKRRWSLRNLADRLPDDCRMTYSSIGEIERGARRVDVDELTMFAAVFDVSPVTLMIPFHDNGDPEYPVRLTGTPTEAVSDMVSWLRGEKPLTPKTPYRDEDERMHLREVFVRNSLPWWAAKPLVARMFHSGESGATRRRG